MTCLLFRENKMDSNLNREPGDIEIDEKNQDEKKRSRCMIICLIVLIVMMLPSTLALLAIF